jgi:hypothetical protein
MGIGDLQNFESCPSSMLLCKHYTLQMLGYLEQKELKKGTSNIQRPTSNLERGKDQETEVIKKRN